MKEESYEEAYEFLAKAEEKLENVIENGSDQLGKPFIVTIYYNIAYLNQKVGRLEECGKYLGKAISYLDSFCQQTDVRRKMSDTSSFRTEAQIQ